MSEVDKIMNFAEAMDILKTEEGVCMGLRSIAEACVQHNVSYNFNKKKFINVIGKEYPEYKFVEPIPFIARDNKYWWRKIYYRFCKVFSPYA